jgi:hypothetical protein
MEAENDVMNLIVKKVQKAKLINVSLMEEENVVSYLIVNQVQDANPINV